jgi:hypothetical protein
MKTKGAISKKNLDKLKEYFDKKSNDNAKQRNKKSK